MRPIPLTTELVYTLAEYIGVTNMYISPRYSKPGDILHELAHNAVCTDEQLANRQLRDIDRPELGYLIPKPQVTRGRSFGRGFTPGISTPDEYGARTWAIEALAFLSWQIPENTGNPHIYSCTRKSLGNGREQLAAWGIYPLIGLFRPQFKYIATRN